MTAIDPNHLAELAADLGAIQHDLDAWSANVDRQLDAVQAQVANLPAALADPRVDTLAVSVQALEERPVPPPYDDSALAGRVVALEARPVGGYDDSDLRQVVESNRVAAADSLVGLDHRLSGLEAEPPPAPYDDSRLRAEIDTDLAAVEARIPTPYDDGPLVARIGAQEAAYGTLSPRVDGAATQAYKATTSATAALAAAQNAGVKADAATTSAAAAANQAATATAAATAAAKAADLTAALARIATLEAAVKALQPVAAWDPTDLGHPFSQGSAWNRTVPTTATYKTLGVDLSSTANGGSPWAEGNAALSSAPPVWIGKASDPVWSCYDPHWSKTRTFHAPDGMYPMTGPDHAAVIYDTTTGTVWSLFMWTATNAATRTITLDAASGGTESCSITGTGWSTRNADGSITKAGVRAAGCSMLGGMVSGADFAKGRCDHALGIILARAFQQPVPVDPALSQDSGAVGTYLGGANAPHQGSWLAIPRTSPAPAGATAEQKVIWACLQEHGGYVVDSNNGFSLCLEPVSTTAAQLASVNSNGFMAAVARALRFVA